MPRGIYKRIKVQACPQCSEPLESKPELKGYFVCRRCLAIIKHERNTYITIEGGRRELLAEKDSALYQKLVREQVEAGRAQGDTHWSDVPEQARSKDNRKGASFKKGLSRRHF